MTEQIDTMTNVLDQLKNNDSTKPLIELVDQIMALPDEDLNENNVEVISGMMSGALTHKIREEAIKNIMDNFEDQSFTNAQAKALTEAMRNEWVKIFDELKPSENKRKILNNIFEEFFSLFDEAVEHYHNYAFELNVKLDKGGHLPTYAHDSDMAADLYASQDMILPAHSLSNKVSTGVHIKLPEGWAAIVVPRSSIGMQTGLRLSNSQGVIDTDYIGEIGVLYDNISDSDYLIKAGDRIAQMYVQPVYHFKPIQVETLEETERGEGGFGSSGK